MKKEDIRIVFMGTPEFAVASLDAIVNAGYNIVGVITTPDKPAGRGKQLSQSAIKQYASDKGLPLLQPERLKAPEFLSELAALKADLQIVIAFRMLPKEVWAMPKLGTFNLHASFLPQYRGAAPINWAVINGEKETGVTTFFLNEKIDEGQIILQEKTTIGDSETAGELHDRLMQIGAKLVLKTIETIATGQYAAQSQEYFPNDLLKPAPKIFKNTCIINWEKPGEEIVNFIRGLSPYPAAITRLISGKNEILDLKIYQASFERDENSNKNGIVFSDNKTFFKVSVPSGWLKIEVLQQSGKKKMSTTEFLRGCAVSKYQQAIQEF